MPTEQEKLWIAAWRKAGPELERIRKAELRQLDEKAGLRSLGAGRESNPHAHGLAIFQAWMMRWRVQQLMDKPRRSDD